jgi:hypothetical protein
VRKYSTDSPTVAIRVGQKITWLGLAAICASCSSQPDPASLHVPPTDGVEFLAIARTLADYRDLSDYGFVQRVLHTTFRTTETDSGLWPPQRFWFTDRSKDRFLTYKAAAGNSAIRFYHVDTLVCITEPQILREFGRPDTAFPGPDAMAYYVYELHNNMSSMNRISFTFGPGTTRCASEVDVDEMPYSTPSAEGKCLITSACAKN